MSRAKKTKETKDDREKAKVNDAFWQGPLERSAVTVQSSRRPLANGRFDTDDEGFYDDDGAREWEPSDDAPFVEDVHEADLPIDVKPTLSARVSDEVARHASSLDATGMYRGAGLLEPFVKERLSSQPVIMRGAARHGSASPPMIQPSRGRASR